MENQKLNSNIPYDLMLNILSRLPLKSLKRFMCVHKSWTNLLEEPHFLNIYFGNHSISKKNEDDSSYLLLLNTGHPHYEQVLFSLSGERYENKVKLDWPAPVEKNTELSIFGSCINGMLCVFQRENAILWNPTTGDVKVIPPDIDVPADDRYGFIVYFEGFGYDHVAHDYKLIEQVYFYDDSLQPFWQIYSLKNNCWRKLCSEITPSEFKEAASKVYLNGECHWWGNADSYSNRQEYDILVSFDLSTETFRTTPIGRRERYEYDGSYVSFSCRDLMVLKGHVAIISCPDFTEFFEISFLGEVGVKESWVKLFNIGILPSVSYSIGVGKKGDIFFAKKNGEVVRFDFRTQLLEDFCFEGLSGNVLIYE